MADEGAVQRSSGEVKDVGRAAEEMIKKHLEEAEGPTLHKTEEPTPHETEEPTTQDREEPSGAAKAGSMGGQEHCPARSTPSPSLLVQKPASPSTLHPPPKRKSRMWSPSSVSPSVHKVGLDRGRTPSPSGAPPPRKSRKPDYVNEEPTSVNEKGKGDLAGEEADGAVVAPDIASLRSLAVVPGEKKIRKSPARKLGPRARRMASEEDFHGTDDIDEELMSVWAGANAALLGNAMNARQKRRRPSGGSLVTLPSQKATAEKESEKEEGEEQVFLDVENGEGVDKEQSQDKSRSVDKRKVLEVMRGATLSDLKSDMMAPTASSTSRSKNKSPRRHRAAAGEETGEGAVSPTKERGQGADGRVSPAVLKKTKSAVGDIRTHKLMRTHQMGSMGNTFHTQRKGGATRASPPSSPRVHVGGSAVSADHLGRDQRGMSQSMISSRCVSPPTDRKGELLLDRNSFSLSLGGADGADRNKSPLNTGARSPLPAGASKSPRTDRRKKVDNLVSKVARRVNNVTETMYASKPMERRASGGLAIDGDGGGGNIHFVKKTGTSATFKELEMILPVLEAVIRTTLVSHGLPRRASLAGANLRSSYSTMQQWEAEEQCGVGEKGVFTRTSSLNVTVGREEKEKFTERGNSRSGERVEREGGIGGENRKGGEVESRERGELGTGEAERADCSTRERGELGTGEAERADCSTSSGFSACTSQFSSVGNSVDLSSYPPSAYLSNSNQVGQSKAVQHVSYERQLEIIERDLMQEISKSLRQFVVATNVCQIPPTDLIKPTYETITAKILEEDCSDTATEYLEQLIGVYGIDYVQDLREKKTDLNILHGLCKNYFPDGIQLLLDSEAKTSVLTHARELPLHILLKSCEIEDGDDEDAFLHIMNQLLHNVNINSQTRAGETPLELAGASGTLKMVEMLIANGADPNICSVPGKNCLNMLLDSITAENMENVLAKGQTIMPHLPTAEAIVEEEIARTDPQSSPQKFDLLLSLLAEFSDELYYPPEHVHVLPIPPSYCPPLPGTTTTVEKRMGMRVKNLSEVSLKRSIGESGESPREGDNEEAKERAATADTNPPSTSSKATRLVLTSSTSAQEEEGKEGEGEVVDTSAHWRLKACTKDQLIRAIGKFGAEKCFAHFVLLCYDEYCTPVELLNNLFSLYHTERDNAVVQRTIRSFLHHWVEHQASDLSTPVLRRKITDLVGKAGIEEQGFFMSLEGAYENVRSPRKGAAMGVTDSERYVVYYRTDEHFNFIRKVDIHKCALHLAHVNLTLHKNITMRDIRMHSDLASKRRKMGKEGSVVEKDLSPTEIAIQFFNDVATWVVDLVLHAADIRVRLEVVERFIDIMIVSIDMGSYNAAQAVFSGLRMHPLVRLTTTWNLISDEYRRKLERASALFSLEKNCQTYRDVFADSQPPSICLLALLCRDILYMKDGTSNYLPTKSRGKDEGMINLQKWRRIFASIDTYHSSKIQVSFPLESVDEELENKVHQITGINKLISESSLSERSKAIEPARDKSYRTSMAIIDPDAQLAKAKTSSLEFAPAESYVILSFGYLYYFGVTNGFLSWENDLFGPNVMVGVKHTIHNVVLKSEIDLRLVHLTGLAEAVCQPRWENDIIDLPAYQLVSAICNTVRSRTITKPLKAGLKKIACVPENFAGLASKRCFWLLANALEIYRMVNNFYWAISDACTTHSCPTMVVSSDVYYSWGEDDPSKQLKISAPEFVFVVNNWAKKQLSDLSLFHANGEWAEGTMHIIGKIVKQSFRIFAHVWHNHRLELAKDVKTFINSRPLYKDALKARQRGTMTDLLKK